MTIDEGCNGPHFFVDWVCGGVYGDGRKMRYIVKLSKQTLELASMAINKQIAKLEHYQDGTSGHAMKMKYKHALNDVNEVINEYMK